MRIWFQTISDWSYRAVAFVGVLLLVILVAVIGAEVFARYVVNSSISWSEELGTILFIWIVFLGVSAGIKHGAHTGLHIIKDIVPARNRRIMERLTAVLMTLFLIIVFIKGIGVTIEMKTQLTSAMQIAGSWKYGAVPVGAFFSLLHMPLLLLEPNPEGRGGEHDLGPAH